MMCPMSATETFKLEVGASGGAVMGTLATPEPAQAGFLVGAVIVCQGISRASESAAEFLDELPATLNAVGLAAARFEHRCADLILEDFDAHTAEHDLDDALAVYRWLTERPDIDATRIGVIGYSLGALAATALARRLEPVNRLCLVAPATARHVRSAFNGSNEEPVGDHGHRLPAAYLPSLEDVDSAQETIFHNRSTLIVHGAADRFIPPTVSFEYQRALEMAGRPVEHVLIARADHSFSQPAARRASLQRIAHFLAGMEVVAPAAAGSAPSKSGDARGAAPKP